MLHDRVDLFTRLLRVLLPETDPNPPQHTMPTVGGAEAWTVMDGVEVQVVSRMGQRTVVAKPLVQIPQLYLSPPVLERAARGVAPEHATTRDLLADAAVMKALPPGSVYAQPDRVQWRHDSATASSMVAFIQALEAARVRPWRALASSLNLNIDDRALSIFGHTGGLRGHRERVDVRIRDERRHTRIRIALSGALPANFSVRAGLPTAAQKLHHPILDRQLVFEGVDDALRHRIVRVDEALLNLIASGSDSDITASRIRVVRPGRLLSTLDELVADALTVARALDPRA